GAIRMSLVMPIVVSGYCGPRNPQLRHTGACPRYPAIPERRERDRFLMEAPRLPSRSVNLAVVPRARNLNHNPWRRGDLLAIPQTSAPRFPLPVLTGRGLG